jgi:hypothetical protein
VREREYDLVSYSVGCVCVPLCVCVIVCVCVCVNVCVCVCVCVCIKILGCQCGWVRRMGGAGGVWCVLLFLFLGCVSI